MGSMNFLSLRELRTSTARINEMLTEDGKIVVTSNGKPRAIMIQVSEADFEETLKMINQIKLTRAINNIRKSAEQSGAADLTMDDIDAEISQARRERRARQAADSNA